MNKKERVVKFQQSNMKQKKVMKFKESIIKNEKKV